MVFTSFCSQMGLGAGPDPRPCSTVAAGSHGSSFPRGVLLAARMSSGLLGDVALKTCPG